MVPWASTGTNKKTNNSPDPVSFFLQFNRILLKIQAIYANI
jgi:hypothetical protein